MNARWLRGSWPVTMLAAAVALVTLSPLLWMVSVSFMAPGEAASFPPPLLPSVPRASHWHRPPQMHPPRAPSFMIAALDKDGVLKDRVDGANSDKTKLIQALVSAAQ